MNTQPNPIFSAAKLITALLLSSASLSLHAQSDDNAQNIEQAKNALEQAKSALETAQNTLSEAQKEQAKPAPKPKTASKPEGDGRLYKWVDESGKISYQDSPPPKDVKVLNSDVLKDAKVGVEPLKELRPATEPEPLLDGSQPVMVYTADNCKPCQQVVLFLTQKQVPFIERDIRTDRKARERLSKQSKQISVPSLFIGNKIVQGHAKPMITRALKEAGYLKNEKK